MTKRRKTKGPSVPRVVRETRIATELFEERTGQRPYNRLIRDDDGKVVDSVYIAKHRLSPTDRRHERRREEQEAIEKKRQDRLEAMMQKSEEEKGD